MSGSRIEVGSIVEFNSGSPTMTVVAIDAINGMATCKWWNTIMWQTEDLPIASLEIVSKPRQAGLASARPVLGNRPR